MAAPIRFLSGRNQQQKIGIEGSTDNQKVLEVVGRVGIGTTIFEPSKSLDVRGDISVSDSTSVNNVNVSGASTFTGAIDANGSLDVDGHTELDDLNVSGVSTFVGLSTFKDDVFIFGTLTVGTNTFGSDTNTRNLSVSGISTFAGNIDANAHTELTDLNVSGVTTTVGLLDINGGAEANTLKVADLAENRVVIAGTGGELEDDANLTFDGTKLTVGVNLDVNGHTELDNVNVSGVSTFAGTADFNGSIDVDGHTELDDVNVSGVSTFAGAADFNGSIDVDGHTELDNVNVSGAITATTFTGNLAGTVNTAAQPNITSVGTLSALTVSGDITANGNIVGDNATNITGIAGVTATTLSGTLQTAAQTNVTSVGTLTGLDVDGHTELDDVNVSGVSTTSGLLDINAGAQANTLKVEDLTDNRVVIAGTGGELEDDTNLTFNGTQLAIGVDLDVDGHTELDNVNVSGVSTFADDVTFTGASYNAVWDKAGDILRFQDNSVASFGTNDDLQIYSDNSNVYILNTQNNDIIIDQQVADKSIQIKSDDGSGGSAIYLKADGSSGEFIAYHYGSQKFATKSNGIDVTGNTETDTLDVTGHSELDDVNVSGASTFTGAADFNGSIDVDGHSELDDVNVSGVSTFAGAADFNGSIDVDGLTNLDEVNVSGLSTFTADISSVSGNPGQINIDPTTSTSNGKIKYSGQKTFVIEGGTTNDNKIEIHGHQGYLNILCEGQGETELYYNDSKKLATTGIGISVLNGGSDTATIAGPANLILDPGNVGDNTGIVRIKGDLYVDGTETVVNSTSVEIADKVIGIATTCGTDLLADGGGIKIGPDNTFLYEHNGGTNPSLKSSENLNVASGKHYQIAETDVLNATTLGNSVVNSSLTNVGTLTGLNVNGIATATTFVGALTGTASIATNLAGGDTGDIPYQSSVNTTTFVDASTAATNQVLLWNGSAPVWANVSASEGYFGGIGVQNEGSQVGTAGSVSTLNFVGNNIVAAATANFGISTITVSDTPTFDSLNVTGSTTIPNISGITTFANDVTVGNGITFYASTGIVSATTFYGDGQNLSNLINQRIEGLQIFDEGVAVGTGYTFAALDVVGNNVSISAVGLGTTARITVSDTPTFDTVTVTNNITANGNIVGDNSTNITGINQVTATTFSGTATQVTVADESSDTNCFPLFVTAATGPVAPKSGNNLTFNSADGTLTATDFNTMSDENLKDNIRTIEDPLAKVVEIRGVNFDWKETQKPSVGVIAQDVEKVFPELVANGEKKTVNYNGLIGLLIEVVKEQQTQINSLNERLSKLE